MTSTVPEVYFLFFRDRFRTVVNVWGDSVGAGVVAHLSEMSGGDLKKHLLCWNCTRRKSNHVPNNERNAVNEIENGAYENYAQEEMSVKTKTETSL